MENQETPPHGSVLIERVMLVGQGLIPKSAFANLTHAEWRIWMTEPDAQNFPPSMAHLRDLLWDLQADEDLLGE